MWNFASSVSSFANGLTGGPARPAARGRHSTGSYTVSARSQKSVAQTSMRSALAERGGVIRKADGFEVFYGINQGAGDAPLKAKAVPQKTEQPDGYEIFYDIKQTPAKVEKPDWTTKHPNMTPEKENKDSPQKESPKKLHATSTDSENKKDEVDENAELLDEAKKKKENNWTEEEVEDGQKETPLVQGDVVEPSAKPPTMCAFYPIATPAASFAPPLTGRCTAFLDGEPALSADPLEGDALARQLMNRLGGNFNNKVEAFSIHTPASSFAPPQTSTLQMRADFKEQEGEDKKSSPTLSATVLEDDAPKNSTPRGGENRTETRRVVKEVRAVATRAMAGIPERTSATANPSGYPSQANQAPRTFTISAARFPSVVASSGSTSNAGRPSTGSVISSTGSVKGRASVPGNFRPSNVTTVRR